DGGALDLFRPADGARAARGGERDEQNDGGEGCELSGHVCSPVSKNRSLELLLNVRPTRQRQSDASARGDSIHELKRNDDAKRSRTDFVPFDFLRVVSCGFVDKLLARARRGRRRSDGEAHASRTTKRAGGERRRSRASALRGLRRGRHTTALSFARSGVRGAVCMRAVSGKVETAARRRAQSRRAGRWRRARPSVAATCSSRKNCGR